MEARKQLLSCERADCPRALRTACSSWLVEVEANLPTVVFAVVGPQGEDLVDVRVHANGALLSERSDGRALAVDPGETRFLFQAPGHEPLEQLLTIREAEKNRLVRATLRSSAPPRETASGSAAGSSPLERSRRSRPPVADRAPSSRAMPLASSLLASVSLAATVSAIAVGVAGRRKYESLEQRCAPTCTRAETRPGRRMYLAADVNAVLAAASAAAALWIYLARERTARTRVEASATANSAFVGLMRAF